MQSDLLQLLGRYAEEREVLVVNRVPGVTQHSCLHPVLVLMQMLLVVCRILLFARQQLQLDVWIAGGTLTPRRQSLASHDRHHQGLLLVPVAQLEDQVTKCILALVGSAAAAATSLQLLAVLQLGLVTLIFNVKGDLACAT